MGVPETGKICGSVLVALDKFYNEYPIASFMSNASCLCGKCKGFGNNKRGILQERKKIPLLYFIHKSYKKYFLRNKLIPK